MMRPTKLEHVSLKTLSSQVLEFEGKARANPIGALSDASFLGKLLVLSVNVRPDWKGTNTLAYLAWSSAMKETSFIILRPG